MDSNKHISNSVKKSTQEFLKNTEFVRSHVDFCDTLIKNGYNLEKAIKKTDEVFKMLSKKETY